MVDYILPALVSFKQFNNIVLIFQLPFTFTFYIFTGGDWVNSLLRFVRFMVIDCYEFIKNSFT